MTNQEYIESGILELYVYGILTEEENITIADKASKHKAIESEIIAIEKSILNLSSSFSPFLSSQNFEKIKAKLELKHSKVIPLQSKTNWSSYMGWAASLLFLLGIGYLYNNLNQTQSQVATVESEKAKLH